MRISQYLMVPILIAIAVLIGSWWIVYERTEQLKIAQANLVQGDNQKLRFAGMENELSGLLILGDLIVASNQTFLLLPFKEQADSIQAELEYFIEKMQNCCDSGSVIETLGHLARMRAATEASAIGKQDWLSSFDESSIAILESFKALDSELTRHQGVLATTVRDQEQSYFSVFIITVLGSLISLSLLAWWISTRVTKPISMISSNAKNAMSGAQFFGLQKGPKELTELSETLSTLSDGLQSALEQERARVLEQQKEIQGQIEKTATLQRQSLNRLSVVLGAAKARVWECNLSLEAIENEAKFREQGTLVFDTIEPDTSTLPFASLRLEDLQQLHKKLLDHIQNFVSLELRVKLNLSGSEHWFQINGQLVDKSVSSYSFVGSLLDIQNSVEQENKITQIAMTDSLTSLANRRAFNEQIIHWLGTETDLTLITVDINDFKAINDRFGHVVGDKALVYVGQTLKELAPESCFVSRLGGDEFAILLPKTTKAQIDNYLDAMHKKAQLFSTDQVKLPLTFSAGISHFPTNGNTQEELMLAADLALYRTKIDKLSGTRSSWFEPFMNDDFRRRVSIQKAIDSALIEGLFNLHLQPIVDNHDGGLEGFEALLRWHSQDIRCSTGEAIEIAEQSGQILRITTWLIDHAAKLAARLKLVGYDTPISINIPAQSFQYQDIPGLIREATDKHGIERSRLSIELTESAFIENRDSTQSILNDLTALGVKIALDDFGTGYSSLSYLHELKVDRLKIDRSFIVNIHSEDRRCATVDSIIDLGRKLQAQVVVEGIETQAELDCLSELGAKYTQGHIFSKPQPIEYWLERPGRRLTAREFA
ncbi:MAG: bifunctional diguanylate cyclase/phosphodiesterase [Halieaceae bacterium]|nr:bifunctional diguanylate cyclase/phosphodiesterase [Halieaceae bacterium]